MSNVDSRLQMKQAAGKVAASMVQNGMAVGLGTGSTAACFIESLIERCRKEDLHISAVATSERSTRQAQEGGIPLADLNTITYLDMTIDGADEIDTQKRMIKGGGGALLREKIIASMSREMVVIVDEHKLVKQLGAFPLAVEIIPFAYRATMEKIFALGYQGELRRGNDKSLYMTDNGNYIVDLKAPQNHWEHPEEDDLKLRSIPGVVITGFFFHLAGRVVVGRDSGKVDIF